MKYKRFPSFVILLIISVACISERENDLFPFLPSSEAVVLFHFSLKVEKLVFVQISSRTVIPNEESKSKTLRVRNSGEYYLNVNIDRRCSGILEVNNLKTKIILMPLDTIEIGVVVDSNGVSLNFGGLAGNINNYFYAKSIELGYWDNRFALNRAINSKATYASISRLTDSIIDNEISFLSDYNTRNNLPEWFKDYEMAEIRYSGLNYKLTVPLSNRLFNYFSDDLPQNYYNFLRRDDLKEPESILSWNYYAFLDNYYLKEVPSGILDSLSGYERIKFLSLYFLKEAKNDLTGLNEDVYRTYLFSRLVAYLSDPYEIDSVRNFFDVKDSIEFDNAGSRSKSKININQVVLGDTIANFYLVDELDSLVEIREYQESIVYLNFWATWCGPCIQNFPNLNNLIHNLDGKVIFINICVESGKENWGLTVDRYGLKGTNLFAEGNWSAWLASYFGFNGIPHYAILGNGNVLYQNHSSNAPDVKEDLLSLIDTVNRSLNRQPLQPN
jgi:thiol-disulfide isomerase/thioredoxin